MADGEGPCLPPPPPPHQAAAWHTLENGGQYVLIGSAPEPHVRAEFRALADELTKAFPHDVRMVFAFDEALSRLLYAAADLILVPSIFEPCGLSQLIAMRYGALPLVRRTGGLADTVFDVDTDAERAATYGIEPNGYVFEGTAPKEIETTLARAFKHFRERREDFDAQQVKNMQQDWSWGLPALDYIDVYYSGALRAPTFVPILIALLFFLAVWSCLPACLPAYRSGLGPNASFLQPH